MQNRTVELLAPAGNMDAVKAALSNGADAVYLGAASFGARSTAGFDEDGLRDAIRLCHLHNRKVHVTVNTLIKEQEFDAVIRTLQMLEKLHADAVLVQDLGLMAYIRQYFPCFDLHLSTQMTLHNAAGARFALEAGANRIVLARECSLDTIRAVARTGIDTEVFVHGALCVCVSGQCYLSSMIGGRSGNRGRCAQPCRMSYSLSGMTGSLLSPRDICTRNRLPELLEAGVASLKIEGRLKRSEYVAVVTDSYRRAIDAFYAGRFKTADEAEMCSLRQIFSRGEFTEGYAFSKQDAGIINTRSASQSGIPIGTVTDSIRKRDIYICSVRLSVDLHNLDGLQFENQSIIYSGPEVKKGNTAFVRMHAPCKPGTQVFRLQDEAQLSQARDTYSDKSMHTKLAIPFFAEVYAYPGKPFTLSVNAGGISVQADGSVCLRAESKALDTAMLQRCLSKTGNTFFELSGMLCHTDQAYLSAAEINTVRRNALEMLENAIIHRNECKVLTERAAPVKKSVMPSDRKPLVFAACHSASEAGELLSMGADKVIFYPADYRQTPLSKELSVLPQGCCVALPLVSDDETLATATALISQYRLLPVIQNISQLTVADAFHTFAASEGIPVYNTRTMHLLRENGCMYQMLSPELSLSDLESLPLTGENILQVYGRRRLMTLTHCPVRTVKGLDKNKASCTLCEQGKGCRGLSITDHMKASYPLIPYRTREGCRVNMMSSQPVNLIACGNRIGCLGCSVLLVFTDENNNERKQIIDAFRAALNGRSGVWTGKTPYTGRFIQGVE